MVFVMDEKKVSSSADQLDDGKVSPMGDWKVVHWDEMLADMLEHR